MRRAIGRAADNIARVAFRQIPRHADIAVAPGVTVEQRVEPLVRVGCYVPGGRFPLPSSLLMTAVPARVAGVREIIAVCPRPEPAVMAAAEEAGVTRLFRVGGAHAVAALAYGTRTVPRVDKIVGPGNRYVAAAKAIVARTCAIDFYAGPTEIVVVAGGGRAAGSRPTSSPRPNMIPMREPSSSPGIVRSPTASRRRSTGKRRPIDRPAVALVPRRRRRRRNADDAMALANRFAAEHLVVDRESLIEQPVTAGAVFVGPYAAQAAGDYATGSNHVLPTSGWRDRAAG